MNMMMQAHLRTLLLMLSIMVCASLSWAEDGEPQSQFKCVLSSCAMVSSEPEQEAPDDESVAGAEKQIPAKSGEKVMPPEASNPEATEQAAARLATPEPPPARYQALVKLGTAEELKSLLLRAEQIYNGEDEYSTEEPIAVVLHSAEIEVFRRTNYRDNKALVDLAARLDAFNVVDLKVCERWMGANGMTSKDIPPFLESVPYGPAEISRLQNSGYASF